MEKNALEFCESLSKIIVPTGSRGKFERMLPTSLKAKIIEKENVNVVTNNKINVSSEKVAKNFKKRYGEFSGSYAQDIEGYDDDTINDAFEGDPDNCWNIY